MSVRISADVRNSVFDALRLLDVSWSGTLEETDFLSRIFNLLEMPSYDQRFTNAEDDIWKHRIVNNDWDDDWILADRRFDLLHAPDATFLLFLCQTIHPIARRDERENERLRRTYNELLRPSGYEIAQTSQIVGKPIYSARDVALDSVTRLSTERLRQSLDSEYITRQIDRMQAAIQEDPGLAVGTAKELVETCCRAILTDRGVDVDRSLDLPQLVKETCRVLHLTPEDIPDSAKASRIIKRMLSNLATVTQGIAELRNRYGTGHGKHPSVKGLQPRHAQLAVGAATTLALFLFETHTQRGP